mgnify:CR=1 FL=1
MTIKLNFKRKKEIISCRKTKLDFGTQFNFIFYETKDYFK